MLAVPVLLLAIGCQPPAHKFAVLPPTLATAPAPPQPEKLRPGDRVTLVIIENESAPDRHVIEVEAVLDSGGSVTLLSNRVFTAAGKTANGLENEVRACYAPSMIKGAVINILTSP